MTDQQQNQITPPLALIDQWWDEAKQNAKYDEPIGPLVATQAARWGANQELDACVKWIEDCGYHPSVPEDLRAARRPKPTSLKELALEALEALPTPAGQVTADRLDTIRLALEALPND